MSEPFIGEIRMVGFNFAPQNWAFCNGQLIAISQNETLFALIGTTYGGDGVSTFQLPDLQCRIPFHQGTNGGGDNMIIGQRSGSESVTLTTNQLPVHSHALAANSASGTQSSPAGGVWAGSQLEQFSTGAPTHPMDPSTTLPAGNSLPHNNLPPFQVVNFVISLFGIFPSQS